MLNLVAGPARERIDVDELPGLTQSGVLQIDNRRRRTFYTDGRFLVANDLNRDQNYFLARQSMLGRAGGMGVVTGLQVRLDNTGRLIRIEAGHGVTATGEIVVLDQTITLDLTDVPAQQRLDASFGVSRLPREAGRNRSGLYIVALRPVEFTAHPIPAAYPASITAKRGVEDGEIIEAAAVTLIPYQDAGSQFELGLRRAHVARRIFVENETGKIPAGALPLAMLALERGVIQWVDTFMVRREVGADHGDVLGLGFAPRATREAQLRQYDQHLTDALARSSAGQQVVAAQHFMALPPGGRMPVAGIDTTNFTQYYFPPEMDVELALVPEDEVPALLEESLLLPPLDLTLPGETHESTSILILAPVTRQQIRPLGTQLESLIRPVRSAVPGLVAQRKPLELLRGLRPLPRQPTILATQSLVDARWQAALADVTTLWYVRRRNLAYKESIVGVRVPVDNEEEGGNGGNGGNNPDPDQLRQVMDERLVLFALTERFAALPPRASAQAETELVQLLAATQMGRSRTLMVGALAELAQQGEGRLSVAAVRGVATRYADATLGRGLLVLTRLNRRLDEPLLTDLIGTTAPIPELDRVALAASTADRTLPAKIAENVEGIALSGGEKPTAAQLATIRDEMDTFVRKLMERLGIG